MKYYITKEGGRPHETTRQDYYSKARRKSARVRTWTQDDAVVAREVIIK